MLPLEPERLELIAPALIELVLELNPMKSKRVQEALHSVHTEEDAHCGGGPSRVAHDNSQCISFDNGMLDGHFKEHFGQLPVRQGKRPQTQVRGRVRNSTDSKLDCLYHLVDEHV